NPLSSSGTLSSMKNLEDAFTFDDQFLNDKPTKEEPGKATVETKAESMVTIPIHQASTSAPPLSTPIIDLLPVKPRNANLEQKILNQDKPINALGFRVYPLENHDLYLKIDKHVNQVIKEVIYDALQVPLLAQFKELSEIHIKEIHIKEILHD
nr:hypothetical protein [Tanacetum cinerariifolium]